MWSIWQWESRHPGHRHRPLPVEPGLHDRRLAGRAGEAARTAPQVDDHAVGADHDPAHVTDEGGDDGVERIDRQPGRGATHPGDPGRPRRIRASVGVVAVGGTVAVAVERVDEVGELLLERGLVDDDVHQRLGRLAVDRGRGRGDEDGVQGVGATLAVGPPDSGPGTPSSPKRAQRLVPVGGELGVGERGRGSPASPRPAPCRTGRRGTPCHPRRPTTPAARRGRPRCRGGRRRRRPDAPSPAPRLANTSKSSLTAESTNSSITSHDRLAATRVGRARASSRTWATPTRPSANRSPTAGAERTQLGRAHPVRHLDVRHPHRRLHPTPHRPMPVDHEQAPPIDIGRRSPPPPPRPPATPAPPRPAPPPAHDHRPNRPTLDPPPDLGGDGPGVHNPTVEKGCHRVPGWSRSDVEDLHLCRRTFGRE